MKLKKFWKYIIGLSSISSLPLTMSAIFANQPRDIKKYNHLFDKLWDKLGIHERTDKKIKIGIIDGGLVDYRILKFDGNTTLNIDKEINEDNYNILGSINNPNVVNSNRVKYDPNLTDDKIYDFSKMNHSFLDYWNKNYHATEIASIIGSDSGLLKNAEIYSTSYNRTYNASNYDILKENLEFFRKNNVEYINMSYSTSYRKLLDLNKMNEYYKNSNLSYINNIIDILNVEINTDYPDEAALIDEYAYKYNMKFFISADNENLKTPNHIMEVNKWINEKLNSKPTTYQKIILEKLRDTINQNPTFWKKASSIQRTKNTFIIGAYNFNNDQIEDFSNGKIKGFEDSPLGIGPDKFSNQSLFLNDQWWKTDTLVDDPDYWRWSGTSFSTPVLLAASALLSAIKKPNSSYQVPELKAILIASFDLKQYNDKINILPLNLGAGYINWDRMKFYADNVRKYSIYDLYYSKSKQLTYKNLISGGEKPLAAYSTYSDLWRLSNSERRKLSVSEIHNHSNIFNVGMVGVIYANSWWIYRQYHLSTLKVNYPNLNNDNSDATNRNMFVAGRNYHSWPYEFTLTIKLRNDFENTNLTNKNVYYILNDKYAIYETRSKLTAEKSWPET
ncbi:S8 family serine peptidase [Mycoplasma sp. 5912]